MSDQSQIIALLDAVGGIDAKSAISIQSVLSEDKNLALPVWYVHPLHEKAEGNATAAGATRQTVTVSFVVITVCAVDDLETWRDELFGAIHGKVLDPTRQLSEFVYEQGEVVDVTATAIWWRDVFSYRIRRCTTAGA